MKNLKKKSLLNSSVKTILIFLGIILVIAVIISSDTSELNFDETNNTGDLRSQQVTSYEHYAYYQGYTIERNVVEIDAVGGDNSGNGVLHIRGAECPPFETSITRARLNFGFNDPNYATSGPPVSYEVRATVRYRNWNDQDGFVQLWVQHDDGNWAIIWQRTGLVGVDSTWDVFWASGSAAWYRSDGSMNFKIVGSSTTNKWYNQPSCKVNIENLRVKLNYGPHAYYQGYTTERNVVGLDAVGGDNIGTGVFHIRGVGVPFLGISITRARLNFGFYNPYYAIGGPPVEYTVKCTVRYRNWNDMDGFVQLWVQHDDGSWVIFWQKTSLSGVDSTWDVTWTDNSDVWYRSDGSMYFKIVGSSTANVLGEQPSCKVNIWNLRVDLTYVPDADAGGPYVCFEGSPITFDASRSVEATGDPLIYRWDFNNDGIWDTPWSTSPTAVNTWYDDFIGFAKVGVSEGIYFFFILIYYTDISSVTVNNVAPIVELGPDQEVDEGFVSFLYTITDPGTLDTHTMEWDFGDGSPVSDISSHNYGDEGTYTVTLTVTDDDGGVGSDTLTITVNNVAPTVNAGPDQTVNEGTQVHFNGWFNDPGSADTHTIEWNFGEGAGFIELNTMAPSNYYQDNGIYTVTLRVTDNDGGVGTDIMTITVNNVAPTVDAGPDQTVDEGTEVYFEGIISDPGADTWFIQWNFGDDTALEYGTLTPSHIFADNRVYTITLMVIDDDGGINTDTLIVTVDNVAPTVDAGFDQTVNEGQSVSFSGTFTDPGADTHTVLWNFGDGSPTVTGTLTPSHKYGDNGIYFVTLKVNDDDGSFSSDFLIVTVNNVAPTVDAGFDLTVDEHVHFTLSGSFTDPGWLDTHTILWIFWDGPEIKDTLNPTYAYHYPGVYVVTFAVIDDDGDFDSDTVTITVLDKTPPTTTLTFLGLYHISDHTYISSTATQILLEAMDAEMPFGSDVAIIQYQIDSTTGTWLPYEEPFTIDIIGTHTVFYRSIDNAGNVETEKSVDVIVNASELTYTGEVSGDYSDPVILEAFLMDIATQEPIPGKTVVFTLGDQVVSAVTLSDGIAYATLILDQPGGVYPVSAFFTEDEEYLGSDSEVSEFTINKEYVYAEYTGDMVVPLTAETITLRATVFDEDDGNWGDLTKIYITITIWDSTSYSLLHTYESLEVEITVVEGVGVALITIPNLPEESFIVQISFDPVENEYYEGDISVTTLIIYKPTGDFVTGGGWIEDENGNKGNFGFNVKYKKNGLPKGQAIYVYREGDYIYIVKANAWVGMAIISDQNYTIFEAKCNVKQINAITGEIVWEEGNYRLIIEAWDHSKDGKEDVFQVRVYDKIGLIFYESGFDPYGFLGGGNIVIHIDEKK